MQFVQGGELRVKMSIISAYYICILYLHFITNTGNEEPCPVKFGNYAEEPSDQSHMARMLP